MGCFISEEIENEEFTSGVNILIQILGSVINFFFFFFSIIRRDATASLDAVPKVEDVVMTTVVPTSKRGVATLATVGHGGASGTLPSVSVCDSVRQCTLEKSRSSSCHS